jgi:membrane-associated phospholipid phosphatase
VIGVTFAALLERDPRTRYKPVVVPSSSSWYPFLDTLADSVNPILAFFAIVIALREWRRSSPYVATICLGSASLGLLGIYAVRFLDATVSLWRDWGGDYSTHAAFATSVVISLAFWCPRRRVLLVLVWTAYLLLVVMGYHRPVDVLTASVVACAVTLPWQIAARRVVLHARADRVHERPPCM